MVALNNESKFGAKMAIWRAQLPDINDNIYFVAGGGSDDLENELLDRVCSAYLDANRADLDDIDDARAMLGAQREPVYFVLPPPIPDEALLRKLQDLCGSAVFIVPATDASAAHLPPYIAALAPGLDPALELANWADYLAARKSFR